MAVLDLGRCIDQVGKVDDFGAEAFHKIVLALLDCRIDTAVDIDWGLVLTQEDNLDLVGFADNYSSESEAGLANMGLVEKMEKVDLGFENVAIAVGIVVSIFDCIALAAADLEFERCNEGKP